jgi:hypothetical protein
MRGGALHSRDEGVVWLVLLCAALGLQSTALDAQGAAVRSSQEILSMLGIAGAAGAVLSEAACAYAVRAVVCCLKHSLSNQLH